MNQSSDVIGTLVGIVILLLFLVVILYVVSFLSGWRSLASQFKTKEPMPQGSFLLYQASFRYIMRYGYLLIAGATPEAFYLSFWPKLAHPRLKIPWSEIELLKPTGFAIFKFQTMKLGRKQRVSFFLSENFVKRFVQMAGVQANAPLPPPMPYAPPPPYAPPSVLEEGDRSKVGLGPEYKG